MSSSEARKSPTRRAIVVALTASAAALAGCADGSGFRPMYGSIARSDTESKLASVDIGTIPGRVGQRIRNELIFQANGGQKPTSPTHRLEVVYRESVTSTLVSQDGDAASQVYYLDATFRLISLTNQQVVLQGASFGRAGFQRVSSIYANVRAREDAENRAARTVAEDLKIRLAAYMSRPT